MGRQQCQKAFNSQVTHTSDPIDPLVLLQSVEDAKRHLPMAVERLQVLRQLITVLSSFEVPGKRADNGYGKKVSSHTELSCWSSTYASLRGKFMANSLLLLRSEAKLDDNAARGDGTMPLSASRIGCPQLWHPVVDLFWALYIMTAVRLSLPPATFSSTDGISGRG